MKPTTVLLTVILLVGGSSCITKDKAETKIHEDVLPEIALKKEDTALAPKPVQVHSTKAIKVKYTAPYIHEFVKKEEPPECGGPLMPAPEEDHIDTMVWRKVEIEAEYPGGAAAWQRFLNRNLRYPQEAIDNEIYGSVVVQFVVDEEGNVNNVEVASGPEQLGAEAVRVIKKSGRWVPAVQGGRYVRSLKKQPFTIHFEVEE